MRRRLPVPLAVAVLALVVLAVGCSGDDQTDDAGGDGFTLSSPAFDEGDALPDRSALGAENLSPPLRWSGVPADAEELAITVVDPDASNFVHWVVWGVPATDGEVAEGEVPGGAQVGQNQFGEPGWGGPQPPAGEEHTYLFTLHALSRAPAVTADTPAVDALAAIEAVTVDRAQLRGQYTAG